MGGLVPRPGALQPAVLCPQGCVRYYRAELALRLGLMPAPPYSPGGPGVFRLAAIGRGFGLLQVFYPVTEWGASLKP